MSKMSDLDATITELRKAAEVINEAANTLAEMFGGTKAEPAVETKTTLTLPEVRSILAEKSRAGHTAEIKALLLKYGADKLSAIDASNYEALIADVEELNDAT